MKKPKLINSILFGLLNPKKLYACFRLQKKSRKMSRVYDDAQLKLYAKILPGDFLHYGYFDDPDTSAEEICINDIYRAQLKYAKLFLKYISLKNLPILDVGCGMGGLTNLLQQSGYNPTALTPDRNQINYLKTKYPAIPLIEDKFENLNIESYQSKFGTIINAESLQYINLETATDIAQKIIAPNGRWLICDYFRKTNALEKSGHKWEIFASHIENKGWKIVYQQNITANILVTLKYIYMWANNIGTPIYDFLLEKFKIKNPGWYHLASELITNVTNSVNKNIEIINPERFAKKKQYMFVVLEKIKH